MKLFERHIPTIDPKEQKRIARIERTKQLVREAFSKIDFTTMKNILDQERIRSGASIKKSLFCHQKSIRFDYSQPDINEQRDGFTIFGSFFQNYGQTGKPGICLYPLSFIDSDSPLNSEAYVNNSLLSILTHEETHASGNNIPRTKFRIIHLYQVLRSLLSPEKFINVQSSGFKRSGLINRSMLDVILPAPYPIEELRCEAFNEGVTDLIAEEVYDEYNDRTGHMKNYSGYQRSYSNERRVVRSFIQLIAESSDVNYDTTWNSIKQGYFSGLNFDDEEIGKLFDELLLMSIIKEIQELPTRSKRSAENLLDNINIFIFQRQVKDRARHVMEQFENHLKK